MIKKAFTLSYDDGINQDRRFLDLINKYNLKCTFNLNSDISSTESWEFKNVSVSRIDLSKNTEIYAGHEIAIHGSKHIHPVNLTDEELKAEFYDDKERLEKLFDTKIHGMAYAYGDLDPKTIEYLKNMGIKYGRAVNRTLNFDLQENLLEFHPTCHHGDPNLFDLGEKFVNMRADKPQIFYLWGHTYELDGDKYWETLEEFFKLIANREDIYYGTNYDVFKYFGQIK